MFLDRNGQVIHLNEFEVSDTATIKTVYVVRLIKDEGIRKTVVGEEKFGKPVSKMQLLYCLAKYPQASFAVKEKIFVLEDTFGLPFNQGG